VVLAVSRRSALWWPAFDSGPLSSGFLCVCVPAVLGCAVINRSSTPTQHTRLGLAKYLFLPRVFSAFAVRTERPTAARAILLCFVKDLGNDPDGAKPVAVIRLLCS